MKTHIRCPVCGLSYLEYGWKQGIESVSRIKTFEWQCLLCHHHFSTYGLVSAIDSKGVIIDSVNYPKPLKITKEGAMLLWD